MTIDAQRFLLAIRDQLRDHVIPALDHNDDAAERASFAVILLGRLVADRFVFPEVAEKFRPRFAALADEAEHALLIWDKHSRSDADDWVTRGVTIADEGNSLAAVDTLRARLVDLVRALADTDSPDAKPLMARIAALDCEWRASCSEAAAMAETARQQPGGVTRAADGAALVTPDACTAYLRSRLPECPELTVDSVSILSGGRSKDTYLLAVRGAGSWPSAIVMRQDTGRDQLLTSICDEYPAIVNLSRHGLAIPRPLMIEPQANELGAPFFLMEKIAGTAAGNYYTGLFEQDVARRRQIALDIAELLGRVHAIDPTTVLPDAPPHHEHLLEQLRHYRRQWQTCAVEPSPLIDYAFAWLTTECLAGIGGPAIVHGDVAVHNILVNDGRLTALLDWELVQVGDPAQDLAYIRPVIALTLPWAEFMTAYCAAGGLPIEERRLRMFAVWGFIRNAAIASGGGDRFHRDHDAAFELGFMGTATAFLEQQMIPLFSGPGNGG